MANPEKIATGLEKTEDAEPEKGTAGLDQARADLEKGAARLEQWRAKLENNKAELDQARAELDQAQAELEDGAAELKKAAEPEQVTAELEKAGAKLVERAAELDQARAELEDRAAELDRSRAEMESIATQLNQARAKLEDKAAELDQARAELDRLKRRVRMINRNLILGFVVVQLYVWSTFFDTTKKPGFPYSALGLIIIIFGICLVVGLVLRLALRSRGFTLPLGIGLINAFLFLMATFAGLYYHFGTASNFTSPITTRVDALYFTLGTITTAGTGNISAVSQLARGIVSIQMCIDLIFVTFILAIAVTRLGERRRADA